MPTLTPNQAKFLALPHQFRAFVGGYGSGKSWALCANQCRHFWEHPRCDRGYFAPTYPMIRDVYYPLIEEVSHDWEMHVSINESNKEVAFYSGKQYRGQIICRSMDNPKTIVGFKIARADIDEIDVMPQLKATEAWRKVLARLRLKYDGPNGADAATTPEGFKFVYNQWVKAPRENPTLGNMYGLIQASTYDNAKNLPDGYIESLLATYPANLVEAYLDGQFVNLTTGSVYRAFDRVINSSIEVIEDSDTTLSIGMDFNVGHMAAVVHVLRNGLPVAVDEIVDAYDTPDMIKVIKSRYPGKTIRVYPDASGDNRKSVMATTTDHQLLKDAEFHIVTDKSNPAVKDRVNSMNAMFKNAEGVSRYKVNINKCPTYTDCLEQQVWTISGEPDKKAGLDHLLDAGGYYITKEFPIIKPARPQSMILRI